MANFLFDVKLFATVRLDAIDEPAARRKLAEMIHNASLSVVLNSEGFEFEVSQDGEADLIEIDGEAPDAEDD